MKDPPVTLTSNARDAAGLDCIKTESPAKQAAAGTTYSRLKEEIVTLEPPCFHFWICFFRVALVSFGE